MKKNVKHCLYSIAIILVWGILEIDPMVKSEVTILISLFFTGVSTYILRMEPKTKYDLFWMYWIPCVYVVVFFLQSELHIWHIIFHPLVFSLVLLLISTWVFHRLGTQRAFFLYGFLSLFYTYGLNAYLP